MTTVYSHKIVAKHFFKVFILFSLLLSSCKNNSEGISENKELRSSPNFILILADDQGWNGTSVEMLNGLKESKSDFYETPEIKKIHNLRERSHDQNQHSPSNPKSGKDQTSLFF